MTELDHETCQSIQKLTLLRILWQAYRLVGFEPRIWLLCRWRWNLHFVKVLKTRGSVPVRRGLRRRSTAARLLILWVRIPPGTRMSVRCECCVLSGRGLCDGLITGPEESYRLWCVVVCDLETSWMRRPWPTGAVAPKTNKQTEGRGRFFVNLHLRRERERDDRMQMAG